MRWLVALTLLVLLLVPGICLSYELRWDLYRTTTTTAICIKTGYDLLIDAVDQTDIPLTLKALGASASAVPFIILGHEYSHGEIPRRLGTEHWYKINIGSPSGGNGGEIKYLKTWDSKQVMTHLVINGIRCEKAMRDEIRKEQTMHGVNYKNSALMTQLFVIKLLNAEGKGEGNDYRAFSEYSNLSLASIQRMALLSILDPFTLISGCHFIAACFGYQEAYDLVTLPSIDYNLYPRAATYEIALAKKIQDCYTKITLESGRGTWNNRVYGGSVAGTICKINNVTIKGRIHWVKNCVSTIEPTVIYKNYVLGAQYSFKKISIIEKELELFAGLRF